MNQKVRRRFYAPKIYTRPRSRAVRLRINLDTLGLLTSARVPYAWPSLFVFRPCLTPHMLTASDVGSDAERDGSLSLVRFGLETRVGALSTGMDRVQAFAEYILLA